MLISWLAFSIYILLLLAVIYFDSRYFKIPNYLTLPAIFIFLAYCVFQQQEWWDIVLRFFLSGGMFFMAGFITSVFLKKESIGGGDIKLITAVALYKGWETGLLIILFSAVSAMVSVLVLAAFKKGKMEDRIPFGFYIAVCGILMEAVMYFRTGESHI